MREVVLDFNDDNCGLGVYMAVLQGCQSSVAALSGRHELYLRERLFKTLQDHGVKQTGPNGQQFFVLESATRVTLDEEEFRMLKKLLEEAQWTNRAAPIARLAYEFVDNCEKQLSCEDQKEN